MARKIVQIAAFQESADIFGAIIALCDDGSVWYSAIDDAIDHLKWLQIPSIPQNEEKQEG